MSLVYIVLFGMCLTMKYLYHREHVYLLDAPSLYDNFRGDVSSSEVGHLINIFKVLGKTLGLKKWK